MWYYHNECSLLLDIERYKLSEIQFTFISIPELYRKSPHGQDVVDLAVKYSLGFASHVLL